MGYYDNGPVRVRAPRGAFRTSPIFLGIVAVFVLSGVLIWSRSIFDNRTLSGFYVFVFVVSGWLISLCLHEFAHALVAFRSGDVGVAQRGYLQLNPLKYAHWLLSIVIPVLIMMVGGFALPGGAVLIDHTYIRNRARETAISLAGPAVNLVIGALCLALTATANTDSHPLFWGGMAFLAYFQITVGIFNLLPVPGLDGGNALAVWLSPGAQRVYASMRPYGFLIVFLILWQTPVGQAFVNGIVNGMISAGLPPQALFTGQVFFQFWKI